MCTNFQGISGHGGRGELNQGPHDCKSKVLINELSHTIAWIAPYSSTNLKISNSNAP